SDAYVIAIFDMRVLRQGCRGAFVPRSFFFQAGDGIRDFHVTGVQTCALPICADCQDSEPAAEVDRRNETALQNAGALKPGYAPKAPLTEEIVIAQRVHSQAQNLVGNFMNNVKIGGAIDVAPINQLADELQNSVDRKSTRLNSSHVKISYAVFCLKKKK